MSDLPAMADGVRASSHERASFEQRLFVLSPLGTAATAAAIFALLAGSFVGIAAFERFPLFAPRAFGLLPDAWPAFVMSLLTAVVLGMQRYAWLKDGTDAHALSNVISDDDVQAIVRPNARRRWASAGGAAAGVAASAFIVPASVRASFPLTFLWFAVVMTFLSVQFARGVAGTAATGRAFSRAIDCGLRIDLLRIDELSVIGRRSARSALVWFSVAATICLFFVDSGRPEPAVITFVVCAAMGLWIFVRPMERVHRRIRAEKLAELNRVRRAIGDLRIEAASEGAAAAHLHALLAYEARIEAVREWPFDQSTLMRVGAYVLIPAIPWFGQALAGYLTQRLIH